jgi:hypothetical protein
LTAVRDHRIDHGDVAPQRARALQEAHLDQLVEHQRLGGSSRPIEYRRAASPVIVGSRILGEGIVGAGGEPGDRQRSGTAGIARHQLAHHRAVRAVAAQHDDGRDASALQQARRREGVLDGGGRLHVGHLHHRQLRIAALEVALE